MRRWTNKELHVWQLWAATIAMGLSFSLDGYPRGRLVVWFTLVVLFFMADRAAVRERRELREREARMLASADIQRLEAGGPIRKDAAVVIRSDGKVYDAVT